jgi:cell division protein FtsQ
MDRSRRARSEPEPEASPPASSRLNVRPRKNRRRPVSVWTRVPRPRAIADACGRAVRRSVPALACVFAAGVVCVGLWLGYRFITTNDRFAIREIQINGASKLSAEAIDAALPVGVGDNVFSADLEAIADRLRAHPWIASADVRRVLPNTLVVEIREYDAVGVVLLGQLYLVDATGRPFKRAEAGEDAGMPIITGLDRAAFQADPQGTARTIAAALEVLARWRASPRPAIGEIRVERGALALRTYDHGTAIELGALRSGDELAVRMTSFDAAWAELSDAERTRARAIHLDAHHVTVALKD